MSTSNGSNQVIRLPSSMVGQPSTIQHIRLPTVNTTNVAGLQQVLPNKQVIPFKWYCI